MQDLLPRDLEATLLLSRTPGIRMRGLAPLFERGLSASEILEWVESGQNPNWKESLRETRKKFEPARERERAEALGIQLIPLGSARYPFLLQESQDPPLILYIKGSLEDSDQASAAIVGSRHPGLYGLEQARRFGEKLAAWGLTVVSGFARGIDRAAHEGALSVSYGRTIAVLGSGLDVIYPKEHESLYEEIQEHGALVSEFALGAPPLAENFPKRNRIIAGLTLGTVVIEAHSRSGSLITAHLAAEEGRDVFALPGRVDQLGSRGTHRLIKEGASLVESPEEVFDSLAPQLWPLAPGLQFTERLGEEETALLNLFNEKPLTLDEAAREIRRPISVVISLLTHLELKKALRKRLDGRYTRVSEAGSGV